MACGTLENKADFFRKASFLARLGSGSASRSVYGGYVLWGITKEIPGSSDEVALPVEQGVDNVFKDYFDSVLIIQKGEKEKSSTSGHALMEGHPFTAARVMQANYNLRDLLRSLHDGNTNNFTEILENEALSLHALMLSSSPGFFLFEARTLEVIKKIREYRRETGTEVGFTLDAGANVHLLYPTRAVKAVRGFINDVLLTYCEHGLVIHDSAGNGPVRMA
jgi:diphosphomevalonate decarboxylase